VSARRPAARPSIHARCAAVAVKDGRTLVCGKSKTKHTEHYDPSADERWTEGA